MKSIKTKFVILILGCVLLAAVVIGGAGIYNSNKAVDEDSAQIMNLICTEKATDLDGLLSRIEQSVQTVAVYANGQLDNLELLKTDDTYREQYIRKLEEVAINAATNTEGAVAVYVRLNPEWAPPTSGLFWSKTAQNGSFQQLTPTDFSIYSPTDMEHVGWYYTPVKNGKATWMDPYMNQNINVRMISYVIPLYMNNQTVGVVGMDIDFDIVTSSVAGMRIYDSGYAFLTDRQGNVVYHRELPVGSPMTALDSSLLPVVTELENGTSGSSLFSYSWKNTPKKLAFRSLSNGMRLTITAPEAEIDKTKNTLIWQIVISTIVISSIAVLLTIFLTGRIIKPLRELNMAAKKIAEGDLSINLSRQTKDEVGTLADSFQQTVEHLRQYINYINGLAYRDSLTGVKNKTAYQDAIQRLEEQMRLGRPEFAVVVFDINGLKQINDTCGHDFGDMLIIDSCKIICRSFKKSPVYRIGGDEFAVILENNDYECYAKLLDDFEKIIKEHNHTSGSDCRVSIARGIALYNYETDLVFGNVFKRADDAMYQNKADMKRREAQSGAEKNNSEAEPLQPEITQAEPQEE